VVGAPFPFLGPRLAGERRDASGGNRGLALQGSAGRGLAFAGTDTSALA